ncbi:unnamed protein product [Didymodactylos carnosus]|uniref:Uncharacterized protein n=1 Tax=Didymodactylos carnosus TaxID=1234261 RepID=A0A8S2V8U8_9BILA|nr:unnamed protein product [Didymodactylos carnosus]CAF4374938.1 unnamed protein product [Didymodactylos carnosus]CAF4420179.1 unnamed protein product [Didymodactylos carnosus]
MIGNQLTIQYFLNTCQELLNANKLIQINKQHIYKNKEDEEEKNNETHYYSFLIVSLIEWLKEYKITDENSLLLIDTSTINQYTINLKYVQLLKQYPDLTSVFSLISLGGKNLYKILKGEFSNIRKRFPKEC